MSRRADTLTRALARVHMPDGLCGCWLWTGPTSGEGRGGGYGRMSLNDQTVAVHKVVYTHFHGYIPSTKQIDHTCNNRLCCSPRHLELVTHRTNQKRKVKRCKT